jgi:molybdate transport system substrate-binding protein
MAQGARTLSIMSGLAVEAALKQTVFPAFSAASEIVPQPIFEPTTVLMRRINEGERADVIIAIDYAMDELAEKKIIRAETRVPIARAILGIGVKKGAPRPDISTVEKFKAALVNARGVAYSRGGASGIYFTGLLNKLDIADEVNKRAVTIPAGFTATKVASGEADLAIQQISELLAVDGIDIAGAFPDELQTSTDFYGAVFAGSANSDGAAEFLKHATSTAAVAAYERTGLISLVKPNAA